MKQPAVYILASAPGGRLYTGVTSNLPQRVWQHKNDVIDGHSKTYKIHDLVYFEMHESMEAAIVREKQIKHWNRDWRIRLIRENNPKWDDLYYKLTL